MGRLNESNSIYHKEGNKKIMNAGLRVSIRAACDILTIDFFMSLIHVS